MKLEGFEKLESRLRKLNSIRFDAVIKKNTTEMFNRAKGTNPNNGGTPVDSGELRKSVVAYPAEGVMGYTKEYAPHVNFGHRTRGNGYVAGQRVLDRNVERQRDVFLQDIVDAIEKEYK